MSTRRTFIRQGGLTAGGLATATALGAAVLPAGAGSYSGPAPAVLPAGGSYHRDRGGADGIRISKMFVEPLSIEMDPFPIALGVMTHL